MKDGFLNIRSKITKLKTIFATLVQNIIRVITIYSEFKY